MTLRAAVSLAAILILLPACPPSPRPAPGPEDGEKPGDYPGSDGEVQEHEEGSASAASSPCGRACVNLRSLGCPEGAPTKAGVSCYRGCLSMARHQRVPTACWSSATTPEAARDCGGLRCRLP